MSILARSVAGLFLLLVFSSSFRSQPDKEFSVIAYYSGNAAEIDQYDLSPLTHIIYSFCHLKGNRLNVDNAQDSATIKKLVSLKTKYPRLKVMLSIGGWGGCEKCSPVFSSAGGRDEFAKSVRALNDYFHTDGLDLDWEYPAIEGFPGHAYAKTDKDNFTALVKSLRNSLGNTGEISFAAGGFTKYLDESVDWKALAPLIDRVNIMSYDLVGGYSKQTGHHTPLYDNQQEPESADHAVRYLDSIGFPRKKMVIGSAMYARIWEGVPSTNNGLYQPGTFKSFVDYKRFDTSVTEARGYAFYRDSVAAAPWAYNKTEKLFATYDDSVSMAAKTKYALDHQLGGIMFWELRTDKPTNGLLAVIDRTVKEYTDKHP